MSLGRSSVLLALGTCSEVPLTRQGVGRPVVPGAERCENKRSRAHSSMVERGTHNPGVGGSIPSGPISLNQSQMVAISLNPLQFQRVAAAFSALSGSALSIAGGESPPRSSPLCNWRATDRQNSSIGAACGSGRTEGLRRGAGARQDTRQLLDGRPQVAQLGPAAAGSRQPRIAVQGKLQRGLQCRAGPVQQRDAGMPQGVEVGVQGAVRPLDGVPGHSGSPAGRVGNHSCRAAATSGGSG